MNPVIGIDFDNTIINYEDVFYDTALRKSLISADTPKNKKLIRDRIRSMANGEEHWMRLQADVYGSGISEARINDGVSDFFYLCKANNIMTYVVSHKTQFAKYDEEGFDLRNASLKWMETNHFFDAQGINLSPDNVFFESTRLEKIQTIRNLGCTHFIDDLEEVFRECSFPEGVIKMVYSPTKIMTPASMDWRVFTHWQEITEYFFGSENARK
jgi:hypothetical protein